MAVQVGGARWFSPAQCTGLGQTPEDRHPLDSSFPPLQQLLTGAITGCLASSGPGGRIRPECSCGRTTSAPINNSSVGAGYSLGCFLWRVDAGGRGCSGANLSTLQSWREMREEEKEEEGPSSSLFCIICFLLATSFSRFFR